MKARIGRIYGNEEVNGMRRKYFQRPRYSNRSCDSIDEEEARLALMTV